MNAYLKEKSKGRPADSIGQVELKHRHILLGCVSLLVAACSTTPEVASIETPGPEAPGTPAYHPSDFVEALPGALEAKLGAPALTRREGDGEYRRYDLSTCALIIILYPDDKGALRTVHMDVAATNSGQAKPDLESCLAAG